MIVRVACCGALALALFCGPASAAIDRSAARGADWLATTSLDAPGNAADAVVARRAAGRLSDAEARRRAASLRADSNGYATSAGTTAKVILGLVATGVGNPRCAGSLDLVERLQGFRRGGRYGRSAWDQALAMAALRALRIRPPRAAARALSSARGRGGWNYALDPDAPDDVTHTALAILGLRAAGVSPQDGALRSGLAWMLRQRTRSGGFAHQRRDRDEANATALAVEALTAVGRRDARARRALAALQQPDGAFRFSAAEAGNLQLATVDAVVALSGRHLPAVTLARRPAGCR